MTAGQVKTTVIGRASTDVLAVTVAVETLLLSDARTLRILSGPLSPLVLLPLLFHWHSDTTPKVPGTKMKDMKVIFIL